MRHPIAFTVPVLLSVLLGGCGRGEPAESSPAHVAAAAAPAGGSQRGAAPTFTVQAFNGSKATVDLAVLLTKGPVVVNFFESWCATCANEQPDVNATATAYAGRVSFVGVSNIDTVADGQHYAEIFKVPYPMAHAPAVWKAYGVPYQPVTVVIAADGRVLKRWSGAVTAQQLATELDSALAA